MSAELTSPRLGGSTVRRALAGLGVAVGSWLSAAAVLDLAGGGIAPSGPYDFVVVAGAGVMPGGVPSDALLARTSMGVDLWRRGLAPTLALTGGVGDWGPAESEVARALAVGWGVPPGAIVSEDRSTSTEGNARELAQVLGPARILVVTDRYHVVRCRRVFGRHFPHADAIGATSPPAVRIRGALREVPALLWYAARGRL